MGNLIDMRRDVEALTETLKSIEDQQRLFNKRVSSMVRDVDACLQDIDLKLRRNRAEHDRIMQEYDNAKDLLKTLHAFNEQKANAGFLGHNMRVAAGRETDAAGRETKESRPNGNAHSEPDPIPAGADKSLDDGEEISPEQLRMGLERIRRKFGNEVHKATKGAVELGASKKAQTES